MKPRLSHLPSVGLTLVALLLALPVLALVSAWLLVDHVAIGILREM